MAATDGVGTKLKIAIETGRHDTIGIDLVAMSVNDLVVQGAEPLFFLDYFACGKLAPETGALIVKGVAAGCREAGCALIGGETAEMPGLYRDGDYDLAGFAVGAAERDALLPRGDIGAGDVVLGLASSGIHSNGYSLARRVVEKSGLGWDAPAPFDKTRTLGEALLTPTRIYVKSCLAAMRETKALKGLAHITGGGFPDNIPRVLPDGAGVALDLARVPVLAGVQVAGRDRRHRRAGNAAHLQLRDRHDRDRRRRRRRCGHRCADARRRDGGAARPGHGGGRGRAARRLFGPPRPRMMAMAKKRVAILISGRGSNMASLIAAAKDDGYPAEIALVVSNRPDAAGLAHATRQGIATAVVDHTPIRQGPRSVRARAAGRADRASHRSRVPRRLHAPADAVVRRPMAGAHAQHPPCPAARVQGPAHARARARSRREDARRDRAFRDPGNGFRPDHRAGGGAGARGDTPRRLAARVLEAEHRIYPQALRQVAEGRVRVVDGRCFIEGVRAADAALFVPPAP